MDRVWQIAALGAIALAPGCAYRFTNTSVVRPEGIRTVAVEAIYDTSREVLPHELMWEALQNAVAASGHFALAPSKTADALLRAHIKVADVSSSGSLVKDPILQDPKVFGSDSAPAPTDFRRLTQAGEIRDSALLRIVVDVELWSLRTRTLLHAQTYTFANGFRAIHVDESVKIDSPGYVTSKTNDHLRYNEALAATFKAQALSLANQAVRDILVR